MSAEQRSETRRGPTPGATTMNACLPQPDASGSPLPLAVASPALARIRQRTARWHMPQQLVLTFHGIGEPPASIGEAERSVWIPLDWFEAILDVAHPAVELTFDDGNSSDLALALPALAERGRGGRFFPLVGRIGASDYLTGDDILALSAAGMSVGSQGVDHRNWRTLGDADLLEELARSRRELSEILGREVVEAACPFGSYNRRVLRALHECGYQRVYNSDGGTGSMGAWLAPRTTVDRGRDLDQWLELAAAGARGRPSPLLLGKRLVKRLR